MSQEIEYMLKYIKCILQGLKKKNQEAELGP